MKNYLAISVPLSKDAHWFNLLRKALSHVNVRWQKGHYHSTIALDDLKALIAPICIPSFTMTLTEVKHIIYKGDTIKSWELPQ